MSTMEKLETSFMLVLWNKLLQRINLTSVSLQKSDLDLNTACSLVQSLADFIMDMRSDTEFLSLEKLAKELNESETYYSETHRAPKRSRKYDYSKNQDTSYDELTPGQKFKISTFFPIIDNLVSALGKRQQAYVSLQNKFGVFREMKNTPNLSPDIIKKKSMNLLKSYPNDLEVDLVDEMLQFSKLLSTPLFESVGGSEDTVPLEMDLFQLISRHSIQSTFPNVTVALNIYLCMMVSNCSGERSFSKLKIIKNELRNTMNQRRLNSLTLMSIEHDTLRQLDTQTIIKDFAAQKARKLYKVGP